MSQKQVSMLRAARLALPFSILLALPAAGQPPASKRVEKDTPSATPAGAAFVVPAGWAVTMNGPMVVLDPPEPGTHVAIVDVKAKDADAAVAAAWASYQPPFKRSLKLATPQFRDASASSR